MKGGIQPVICPACEGTGEFELPDGRTQPCAEWDCNGTGQVMGWAIEIDGERIESTEQMMSTDTPLDAHTYRRLAVTGYDWSRLYDRETLADWLGEQGWSVRREDHDATGRDRSVYVVSKRATLCRGLGGAGALYDIAEEEAMSVDGVQMAVIEHAGGPDWPDEEAPKIHPPAGSDLRR